MNFRIDIEDPETPDVLALLEDGERYGASLYPAESNQFLDLDTLRGADVRFVVARDGQGIALGTGAIALHDGWAELKRMWVVPEARGKGLSKAILIDLEKRARAAGIALLRLETDISNHEAIRLYERSGFLRRDPFGDYRPDPLSVFMEKALGAADRSATLPIEISALAGTSQELEALASVLVETVANGGSVSFMHPLAPEAALAFWTGSLAAAARGERIVLGAFDGDLLVGTVTLLLDLPPNQPHRAEIAKLMMRISHRGRGIAARLVQAAERLAVERARSLIVLDTATEEGAGPLYEKLGYHLAGEIPDYALKPHGGLTGTLVYWKRIGVAS